MLLCFECILLSLVDQLEEGHACVLYPQLIDLSGCLLSGLLSLSSTALPPLGILSGEVVGNDLHDTEEISTVPILPRIEDDRFHLVKQVLKRDAVVHTLGGDL